MDEALISLGLGGALAFLALCAFMVAATIYYQVKTELDKEQW